MPNETPAVEHLEETYAGPPRCRYGSKTEHQCWREATMRPWAHPEEQESLCAEHARLVQLGEEEWAWAITLSHLEEWIAGPVAEAEDDGHLERLAFNIRDEATREYGRVVVEAKAAKLVADEDPPKEGERRLSHREALEFARRFMRSDALSDARAILEDVPDERFGKRGKFAAIACLDDAAREASEEVERYRREIGLSLPASRA